MRVSVPFAWAAVAACLFTPSATRAAEAAASADEAAMNEEVAYIDALVEANLPDFAAPVIAAAKKKWPVLGPRLRVKELQGELRLGHFDVVQKEVDKIKDKKSPEYWALRLSMGDAYYARGDMANCSKIYKEFFAAVPTPSPALKSFYIESAYKYAQMLVNEKSFDAAVKIYDGLLKQDLEENAWCAIATDCTELLLRLAAECNDPKQAKKKEAYLAQATVLADKLLWKNELIIVFGRAISMKAHIEMLRGNVEKAQGLVNDYMKQLSEIHASLVEQDPDGKKGYVRMSPMPQCRYLLAKMLWDSAQKESKEKKPDKEKIVSAILGARPAKGAKRNGLGAFNHAINVFIKYPESSWAANAGQLVDEIAAFFLARYNVDLKKAVNISPEQKRKVRQMQFQNADEIFRSNDFAATVHAYFDILAQFPEVEESVNALSSLAEAEFNLWKNAKDPKEKEWRRLETDAVEGYFGERFSGSKHARAAGEQILRLAAKEHDAGSLARSSELHDLYFRCYADHYQASQLALTLAGKALKAEDWEKAIRYYGLIATVYTNSTYYATALQCLSMCHGKLGHKDEQIEWLRAFSKATKKPAERTTAQLSLALMQQKNGFAAFEAAAETNDTAVAETMRKEAYRSVAGAIKDFRAVGTEIGQILESEKSLPAQEKEKYLLRREQAMFLEGDSWQRLTWPADKVSVFRQQAVKAYERYLQAFPKGKYGPVALVKIGTIWTAEKNMDESQKAFARLQTMFPDSDEAKNSVPRLAKTLIEMGLKQEGVAEYRKMLSVTDGKYSAGQFLQAGEALLEAKSWDVAQEAYQKAMDLSKGASNAPVYVARGKIGQAKAFYGAGRYAEAHETLDAFIEKNAKSALVVDAYEMLVETASEEGRTEKDDALRMKYFNQAVGAIKKLRGFRKQQAEQDVLDLRSGDVLVRKMEAEETMGLKEQARETCGRAVVTFQAFLMAHEPTAEHPAKDMTPAQLANLERCYGTALPLMAKLGKDQAELILKYGQTYVELFPDGKHKTAVQNAINQAKAE